MEIGTGKIFGISIENTWRRLHLQQAVVFETARFSLPLPESSQGSVPVIGHEARTYSIEMASHVNNHTPFFSIMTHWSTWPPLLLGRLTELADLQEFDHLWIK